MNIILAGGINEAKYKKVSNDLISLLKTKGITANTSYVNTYVNHDLSELDANMDVVVVLGAYNIITSLPVIDGMGLIYPWMGKDQVLEKIKEYKER